MITNFGTSGLQHSGQLCMDLGRKHIEVKYVNVIQNRFYELLTFFPTLNRSAVDTNPQFRKSYRRDCQVVMARRK